MKRIVNVTKAMHPKKIPYMIKHFNLLRSHWYTNDGICVRNLEKELANRWEVKNVIIMANGTLPLIFLMENLPKQSKVATTPFSYIATASSIKAAGHRPVFIDLVESSMHVDFDILETSIKNGDVDAILLTNVYGIMPDLVALEKLKITYKLPVYLDASHSFGVAYNGKSALSFGDASTISFHATKIFSTIEGGALVTNDDSLADAARKWRNFGISNGEIEALGINAKMSEFHALFGLQLLPLMSKEIKRRQELILRYKEIFKDTNVRVVDSPNGSYAPVIFPTEMELISFQSKLSKRNILTRRYFYPSLDTLSFLSDSGNQICKNSRDIAGRVLCLPIGNDVTKKTLIVIGNALNERF